MNQMKSKLEKLLNNLSKEKCFYKFIYIKIYKLVL